MSGERRPITEAPWWRKPNLPSIFTRTIYRHPTDEELAEVDSCNLTSEEIVGGVGYTIIGRGIKSEENAQMIYQTIKRLSEMFPEKEEYKKALEKVTIKEEVAASTTTADVPMQPGIIKPDGFVRGTPTFDIDDSGEFHSFAKGIKRFHLWKQHTKSETVRNWARQNPGKEFYVRHQGHHTLIRRGRIAATVKEEIENG